MSEQHPAKPEPAPAPALGDIARIHGLASGTWVRGREAFAACQIDPDVLAYWADSGVISARRATPSAPREYLREELVIVGRLARPVRLRTVRNYIAARQPKAPGNPASVLGRLGQVHGFTLDHEPRWMTSRHAAELSGVRATVLNSWARNGLISFRQPEAEAPLWYLAAEMEILRGLAVQGRAPTVKAVRKHVLEQVGQQAENARTRCHSQNQIGDDE